MKSVSLTEEEKSLLKSATKEGDLATLDFRPRISLALILDPKNQGSDWKALAKCLSLSHLEGGLETMTSPTKELLTMYEVSNCVCVYNQYNTFIYIRLVMELLLNCVKLC